MLVGDFADNWCGPERNVRMFGPMPTGGGKSKSSDGSNSNIADTANIGNAGDCPQVAGSQSQVMDQTATKPIYPNIGNNIDECPQVAGSGLPGDGSNSNLPKIYGQHSR